VVRQHHPEGFVENFGDNGLKAIAHL